MRRLRGAPAAAPAPPGPPAPTPPPPARAEPPEDAGGDAHDLEVSAAPPGSLLLDVREPREFATGVAAGSTLLPMDLVPHHLAELPRDQAITVVCAHGVRSLGVADYLREMGYRAASLAGGIHALGLPLARPAGLAPGTRLSIPAPVAGTADELEAEVIHQLGDQVRVRARDARGAWVRLDVPIAALTPG